MRGVLDEDEGRGQVPGIELRLEHRLAGALGHERITPEVTESAIAPGRADDGIEPPLLAGSGECRARGIEDLGVLEARNLRDAQAPLARPGATTAHGVPALVHRRRRHHAHLQLARAFERDQGRERRDTSQVAVGGVDRVDDPSRLLVRAAVAIFLGEDAVRRISLFDACPQLQLDGGVGLGDVGAVRFTIDARAATKMLHRNPVGGIGELEGERRELLAFAHDRILSPAGS